MRRSAVVVVLVLVLFPIIPWLLVGEIGPRFTGTRALKSVANISALCGIAGWAMNLVLASRTPRVERVAGGLEQLYRLHRRLGVLVVALAVTHVVFLSLHAGRDALDLYLPNEGWSTFTGVIALVVLVALVASSLLGHLSYRAFVLVQRALGVAFAIGTFHTFAVAGTKASSRFLTIYLAVLTAAAALSLGYRLVGGAVGLGRARYVVDAVRQLDAETVEIGMTPVGRELAFRPGQFVYASFGQPGLPRESHPFTVASSPDGGALWLAVKGLGDFTRKLSGLEPGARVQLEGPFGSFCLRRDLPQPQTWVAGGIGITPFLSWARSLDTSIAADLYYCAPGADQHHFLTELYEIADRFPAFRVIPMRKSSLGHLSVDDVEAVNPRIATGHVFLCGPPLLVDNLTAGFVDRGVPKDHIHSEAFDFR